MNCNREGKLVLSDCRQWTVVRNVLWVPALWQVVCPGELPEREAEYIYRSKDRIWAQSGEKTN